MAGDPFTSRVDTSQHQNGEEGGEWKVFTSKKAKIFSPAAREERAAAAKIREQRLLEEKAKAKEEEEEEEERRTNRNAKKAREAEKLRKEENRSSNRKIDAVTSTRPSSSMEFRKKEKDSVNKHDSEDQKTEVKESVPVVSKKAKRENIEREKKEAAAAILREQCLLEEREKAEKKKIRDAKKAEKRAEKAKQEEKERAAREKRKTRKAKKTETEGIVRNEEVSVSTCEAIPSTQENKWNNAVMQSCIWVFLIALTMIVLL